MVSTLALLSLLAATPPAGPELWLVRPLYPGQEQLAARTEDAIRELMPPDLRASEIVGRKELERYLNGKALNMLQEEGMPQVWRRHHTLASAVWAAFDAWGAGNPAIGMNVANPADRGWSVTAARLWRPPCNSTAFLVRDQGRGHAGHRPWHGQPSTDPAYHGFLARGAYGTCERPHDAGCALAVMEAGMVALGISRTGRGGSAPLPQESSRPGHEWLGSRPES